ncbi:MAG TPA: class I adenylate-forming enzyme family protein [Mycobacteriales bacterium]|nr:class I adenylate-forming enzyme family protein [Mycobacteriales bacterium]
MLIELLRASADRDSRRALVVSDSRTATVGEVLARAEAAGAELARRRPRRLACVIEDVASLVAVLCGAAASGTEVCVCPTYFDDAALNELLDSLDAALVVTDTGRRPAGRDVVTVAELCAPSGAAEDSYDLAEDPELLILTTGTTGKPKPTRQRWSRLVAGIANDPGSRWLLTYNVNQFAGIQVLLHVLVNDGTIVVPASRRPTDAAAAIAEHGVTHASGTPTFWRLLLVDAGSSAGIGQHEMPLRQITLGGEVVPGDLLERLHRAFPAARITHIYAGTEFGSAVAVSDGLPGLPASLLERADGGRAQLRVVDGELQVRSTVGMVGYADDDEIAGEWFPTGDLVEVSGDRVMFVGRINDRINVGGTKVSPHAIEAAVHAVDGVALAAAYGKPNPITGSIVAVDVVAAPGHDPAVLKEAIRRGCEALPPAARPRLIRFVDTIEQRGGKVVRAAAADAGGSLR